MAGEDGSPKSSRQGDSLACTCGGNPIAIEEYGGRLPRREAGGSDAESILGILLNGQFGGDHISYRANIIYF